MAVVKHTEGVFEGSICTGPTKAWVGVNREWADDTHLLRLLSLSGIFYVVYKARFILSINILNFKNIYW